MKLTVLLALAASLLFPAAQAATAIGQFELRKRTATGFDSYGVTPVNSKAIGFDANGVLTTIDASGGTGSAHTIKANTVVMTDRAGLNFSTAFTVTDNAGTNSTDVTLATITSLGTITTGVWNGTAIGDAYISSSATWSAKQDGDATLTALATTGTANTFPYFTATDVAASASITAAGLAILDDADAAAQRTTLGLGTMALQPATSPTITTSIVTGSTSFTAFAGATTLLTIGGTGSTATVSIPGTEAANGSAGTGALSIAGGLYVAKDAWFNGVRVGLGGSLVATNQAVGLQALLSNTTGFQNTGIGYQCLRNNTDGPYNTAVGHAALASITTGRDNTAVGDYAGLQNADTSNKTSADYSTFIGSGAGGGTNAETNVIALGFAAMGEGSNSSVIGNSSSTKFHAFGTVVTDASTTTRAGFRLPHGTAPTSPTNGDVWTTTAGVYARINGSTVGPFGAGAGTGDMLSTNNLSDVANAATARTNLGLGTAATKNTGVTNTTIPTWGASVYGGSSLTWASELGGTVTVYTQEAFNDTINVLWPIASGVLLTDASLLSAGNITGTVAVANGGTGATALTNLITLGTHTTGNYVATIADSGAGEVTVTGSGSETAAVTLALSAGITRDTEWDTSAEVITHVADATGTSTGAVLVANKGPTFAGGDIKLNSGSETNNGVSFYDSASAFYARWSAPSLAANYELTWPATIGSDAQVLIRSGASGTAWASVSSVSGYVAPVTSVSGTADEVTVTGTSTPVVSLPSAMTFTGKTVTGGTFVSPQVSFSGALGTDDTYSGTTIVGLTAGATIAQWEAVYLGGSSTWLLADANGSGTYPARGLAVAAYSSTNAATVITHGTVRNDAWNWTPGGTVYLSTTAGGLTQTAPSTSGDKVQQIGFALTADIIFVDFASGETVTVQ